MSSPLRKMSKARQRNANKPVVEVKNERQFRQILRESEIPIIVDFWAPWCQPCKMQGPVFDAAAVAYKGTVKFVKINTEASQKLAKQFNISSIPSLLVFDGEEIIDARMGLTGRPQLDTMLRRALDKHEGVTSWGKIKRIFTSAPDAA